MERLDDLGAARSFLDRFASCYDSLLQRVDIRLGSSGPANESTALLEICTRQPDGHKWVVLRLRIAALGEFRLAARSAHDIDVLYDGVDIRRDHRGWLVNLSGERLDAGDAAEAEPLTYFVGGAIEWEAAAP